MIELNGISKRFGRTSALADVSLRVPEGAFVSLLGPSGCGKSTTLRIMAGLEHPTQGTVRFHGEDVADKGPAERNIAMVFQSFALYPHLTVRQNLALPLAMRHLSRIERVPGLSRLIAADKRRRLAAKVENTARTLALTAMLDRKPGTLSGGQKQRVALGRALVRDPFAFLLDEPLSNLDARLRVDMRAELVALHRRTGKSFIYVTHDQAEAMAMSDRIAVFMAGRIVQEGTPRTLYEAPATQEVAAFIGEHPIALCTLDADAGHLPPPFDAFVCPGADGTITLGVRPEDIALDPTGPIRATVEDVQYLGGTALIEAILTDGSAIRAAIPAPVTLPAPGETVALSIDPGKIHAFDAAGARLREPVALRAPLSVASAQ